MIRDLGAESRGADRAAEHEAPGSAADGQSPPPVYVAQPDSDSPFGPLLKTVRPVLEQLGEVHYVGDVGSAATLKLVANSFLGIVSAGAAELMAAGTAQGLEPEQVFTVLSRVAPGLKVREAGFVGNIHEPAMFAVRDLLKDLDLGLGLYQRAPGARSKVPLTGVTRELFAAVSSRVPDQDISAIATAYSTDRLPRQPVEELAS